MISLKKILVFSTLLFFGISLNGFSVDTLFICKGDCIRYTNTTTQGTPIAWDWVFQGGTPGTSNLQQDDVCYPTAGVFLTTIKTTFDDNSDTTDSVYVVVFDSPIPAFTFPKDTGYCAGENFPLQLNTINHPFVKYLWSDNSSGSSLNVNTQGKYWVQLLLGVPGNTCDSVYKEVNITEYPKPSVYLGQDKLMCQNQIITLDAGSGAGYTYLWTPNNEVTQQINVSLPGIYSVEVSNSYGCKTSDQIELRDSCPHYVFIPNAISPNEDRLNDVFTQVWNFTPTEYTLSIYNRWGELLFETNDFTVGWNCKYNEELVQQDVYVYKISYYDTDKKWYEMRGTFYVVR
ncbi:MAG: gliding motility-associated C-terminal domain-containing protein [Bacteroidia bacterium]